MSTAHLIGREEVMAFLDGELAPPRAAIVRAHVDGCAECSADVDEWRSLSQSLRGWRVEQAPASLVAPTGEVAPMAESRVPFGRFFKTRTLLRATPLMVAAAVVVVVSLVVLLRMGPALDSLSADRKLAMPAVPPSSVTDANGALQREESAARYLPEHQYSAAFSDVPISGLKTEAHDAIAEAKQSAAEPRMIVRTATLGLSTNQFDDVLKRMQAVAGQHGGTVSDYQVSGNAATGRALSATVRVPVAAVDAALVDLRKLGTVAGESQATQEITDAHRDLAIRIDNAKREAERLNELLARQSDRLADVLQVEQAQARVQTEIEQMTAEETAMRGRAAMSSIQVSVAEVRHAQLALGPLPVRTRTRNAMVDGARAAADSALWALVTIIALAPSLLLWFVILATPAVLAWWGVRVVRRVVARRS